MPISDAAGPHPAVAAAAARQRGFSYLLLMFVLAIGSAMLAAAAEQFSVETQRERESELLWRGKAIRAALDSYHAVQTPRGLEYPTELIDLLEDRRTLVPQYHLRRLYLDPFSATPDWGTVRDEKGHIRGVYTRSRQVALRHVLAGVSVDRPALPGTLDEQDSTRVQDAVRVGDWRFIAGEPPGS
jgi:type II secretory pathway pseudopilin PulG